MAFRDNFISVVSILLAKFREWTKQLRHCQDAVTYILKFCHSKTSKRIFQTSPTHQNVKMMFYRTIYQYGSLPCRYLYIGICIVRPNYGIHQHGKCFSSWELIVTQTEKQIESQSSFNKDSRGPKTRSRIFKATFITLTCVKCLLMVFLIRCQQKSHCCYSKRNQKGLANFSQSCN